MKKIFVLLLAALILLSLTACKQEGPSGEDPTGDPPPVVSDPDDGSNQPDDPGDGELTDFAFAKEDVERIARFVSVFNSYLEPFDSPAALSDEAMVFAAAKALDSAFLPTDDGQGYYVTLASLNAKVKDIFGPDAKLSDDFSAKDYSPFFIDPSSEQVLRYVAGGPAEFYWPYKLVEVGENRYELWQVDLMDPLFFDVGNNQDLVLEGAEITSDQLASVIGDIQKNIYTVKIDGNNMTLVGFRFEQDHEVDHFMF